MNREWKPGDVAWLPNHGGVIASRAARDCKVDGHGYADGEHWHYLVSFGEASWDSSDRSDARPLVVIDPEDREQVERLLATYHDWKWARERSEASIDDMAAALREFANPTPPKCKAALIVRGEHFPCDQTEGHGMSHANADAGAIWGESE